MNDRSVKTWTVPAGELLALSHDLAGDGITLSYRSQPSGVSMWPFMHAGDEIFVEHAPEDELRINDVIVFRHPGGSLIAHRLLKIENTPTGTIYRTRGDALRVMDPPLHFSNIVGRVNRIVRRGRTISPHARSMHIMVRLWLFIHPLPQLARAGFLKLCPPGRR
jgi:signal peptidase I